MQQLCQGVSGFATTAASWAGRTVSTASTQLAGTAQKVATLAQPYFSSMMNFLQSNKGPVLLAVGGAAVGALSFALFQALCSRKAAATAATV
jgi:hypothetical protein